MNTELYHCTDIKSLEGILSSQAFYPSFCLEKAEYLENCQDFAFAMVCFADLLPNELHAHMEKFNATAYLKMDKKWAIRNGVAPIVYYSTYNSPFSACIRFIIEKAVEVNGNEASTNVKFVNAVNVLLAYLKQYEGKYWIKSQDKWSEQTQFFTEREWRYVPLVENGEAYYLDSESFYDKNLRSLKQKELKIHGYVLYFSITDVLEIGVQNQEQYGQIANYITSNKLPDNWLEKIKVIGDN